MSASANNVVPLNHDPSQTIECRECGFKGHSLYKHLADTHGMTAEQYVAKHPGAPLLSALGQQVFQQQISKTETVAKAVIPHTEHPYDSSATFGVGFNKSKGFTESKPIRGYKGFTSDHGVPDIDPTYVFPPDMTRDMLMGMTSGGKIYAGGPTGCGKTTMFEQFAARTGRPFYRLQFHGEMEPIELWGMWFVNQHSVMEYMYSGLVHALQQPSVIVFDEYDSGNSVVTAAGNALLEGKPMVIQNKGGEKIVPHRDCLIVATGNTFGMGDDSGLYSSTSVQSFATMNRFRMFLSVDYVTQDLESEILTKRFPSVPNEVIKDICKTAHLHREGFKGGKMSAVLSTRQVINWCHWTIMTADVRRAFNLAFWTQLSQVDQKVSAELYQRVFRT